MLPKTADFVVIGAGIGSSIAFNLAKLGAKSVVVLEKKEMPKEPGKYFGAISQQFSSPINALLSKDSLGIFKNWKEQFPNEIKYDINFRQNGSIFLIHSAKENWEFALRMTKLQKLGVNDFYFIDNREILERLPYIDTDGIIGGAFFTSDAITDIATIRAEYIRQAEMLGVQFFTGIEVLDIGANLNLMTGRKKTAEIVFTDKGPISTHCVINAAGPFAAEIGRMLNIEIPIKNFRRYETISEPIKCAALNNPMFFEYRDNRMFYSRVDKGEKETGYSLLMGAHDANAKPYDSLKPAAEENKIDTDMIIKRISKTQELRLIKGGITGFCDLAPDLLPILGKTKEAEGLILANGFCGHGFMHTPIIGKIIAEIAFFGKSQTFPDISRLGLDAFENKERPPAEIIII